MSAWPTASCRTLAPPPEGLVQFGGVNPVQPHKLAGNDDRVAVDDPGGAGERMAAPAERQNRREIGRKTTEH
jgi:hypothetical protein